MKALLYYLGVAALFTHELDAILNMEWRLLFHLRSLSDEVAGMIFVALHLPLFFVFFYMGHHNKQSIRDRFRVFVAAFLLFHSGLHFNLSDHEQYQFAGFLSNLYIYGAALCGFGYLAMSWRSYEQSHRK